MKEEQPLVRLIYLRDGRMLLSRKYYDDWRGAQDEYDGYMTSLDFFSEEELTEFLRAQYGDDDALWGFTRRRIREFMSGGKATLSS